MWQILLLFALPKSLGRCFTDQDISGYAIEPVTRYVSFSIEREAWIGHYITSAIAKIILEELMSYPVTYNDTAGYSSYEDVAVAPAQVNLEVWPDSEDYEAMVRWSPFAIETNLGIIGRSGWFIPTYLLNGSMPFDFWRGYETAEIRSHFPPAGTIDPSMIIGNGREFVPPYCALATNPPGCALNSQEFFDYQCNVTVYNPQCIELYGQSYDYDPGLLQQQIYQNGLLITVPFLGEGSSEVIQTAIQARLDMHAGVLFYWWTPSDFIAQGDFTRVALADATSQCYRNNTGSSDGHGSVNCDFLAQSITKLYPRWFDTQPDYADAVAFIRSLRLTTEQQAAMMQRVTLTDSDSWTTEAERVACDFLKADASVWMDWVFNNPVNVLRQGDRLRVEWSGSFILLAVLVPILLTATSLILVEQAAVRSIVAKRELISDVQMYGWLTMAALALGVGSWAAMLAGHTGFALTKGDGVSSIEPSFDPLSFYAILVCCAGCVIGFNTMGFFVRKERKHVVDLLQKTPHGRYGFAQEDDELETSTTAAHSLTDASSADGDDAVANPIAPPSPMPNSAASSMNGGVQLSLLSPPMTTRTASAGIDAVSAAPSPVPGERMLITVSAAGMEGDAPDKAHTPSERERDPSEAATATAAAGSAAGATGESVTATGSSSDHTVAIAADANVMSKADVKALRRERTLRERVRGLHLHALYVYVSSAFVCGGVIAANFMMLRGLLVQADMSDNGGLWVAGLFAYLVCTPLAVVLIFFLRGTLQRYVAALLYTLGVSCLHFLTIVQMEFTYNGTISLADGVASALQARIVLVSIAVAICLVFMAVNVAKLKLSRSYLDGLVRSSERHSKKLQARLDYVEWEWRRAQVSLDVISTCRPLPRSHALARIVHTHHRDLKRVFRPLLPVATAANANPASNEQCIRPTLDALLANDATFEILKDFMFKQHDAEMIMLFQDIKTYKSLTSSSTRKEYARRMFDLCIAAGAEHQVNVSATQVKAISKHVDSAPANLFDVLQNELLSLMATNTMPQFIKTDGWNTCLALVNQQTDMKKLVFTNDQMRAGWTEASRNAAKNPTTIHGRLSTTRNISGAFLDDVKAGDGGGGGGGGGARANLSRVEEDAAAGAAPSGSGGSGGAPAGGSRHTSRGSLARTSNLGVDPNKETSADDPNSSPRDRDRDHSRSSNPREDTSQQKTEVSTGGV